MILMLAIITAIRFKCSWCHWLNGLQQWLIRPFVKGRKYTDKNYQIEYCHKQDSKNGEDSKGHSEPRLAGYCRRERGNPVQDLRSFEDTFLLEKQKKGLIKACWQCIKLYEAVNV